MNEYIYQKMFIGCKLKKLIIVLRLYMKEIIFIFGECSVIVVYGVSNMFVGKRLVIKNLD